MLSTGISKSFKLVGTLFAHACNGSHLAIDKGSLPPEDLSRKVAEKVSCWRFVVECRLASPPSSATLQSKSSFEFLTRTFVFFSSYSALRIRSAVVMKNLVLVFGKEIPALLLRTSTG
jgi:hypothetical protein